MGIDHPDLGEQREKHKEDQLQKQKEGKGHWKPELASDSEEAVCSLQSLTAFLPAYFAPPGSKAKLESSC